MKSAVQLEANRQALTCTECGTRPMHARGLCNACYHRALAHGTHATHPRPRRYVGIDESDESDESVLVTVQITPDDLDMVREKIGRTSYLYIKLREAVQAAHEARRFLRGTVAPDVPRAVYKREWARRRAAAREAPNG